MKSAEKRARELRLDQIAYYAAAWLEERDEVSLSTTELAPEIYSHMTREIIKLIDASSGASRKETTMKIVYITTSSEVFVQRPGKLGGAETSVQRDEREVRFGVFDEAMLFTVVQALCGRSGIIGVRIEDEIRD